MKNLMSEYIEGFSRERFQSWKNKAVSIEANEGSESKYLDCFIFTWIAFNHYYASWWYNRHRKDNVIFRDQDVWKECIKEDKLMGEIYSNIKSIENLKLELPVGGGRKGDHPAPSTKAPGKYTCNALSLFEFFQICYRIRNNLIHGTKDFGKKRDQKCTKFAYKNLVLFLKELQERLQ